MGPFSCQLILNGGRTSEHSEGHGSSQQKFRKAQDLSKVIQGPQLLAHLLGAQEQWGLRQVPARLRCLPSAPLVAAWWREPSFLEGSFISGRES